jgi:transposase
VIGLPDGVRVYLAAGRTDLRRGIDGLAAQIQTVLREDPFSGHLFIFRGRAAHTIKVLMYDGSGFLLMQKRLTEGKFIWPSPADGIVSLCLSSEQRSLLLLHYCFCCALPRGLARILSLHG